MKRKKSAFKESPRYRTLTIYNVFFEQNKKAEGGLRNTTTGDSVCVSCFYSHKGTSWIHVYLCHCPDFGIAYDFVYLVSICNIIYKET